jgi:mRNA interferase MazF
MKRGEVYWVNLEPAAPPEFGKTRPAVIVSNTEQNQILSSVVVVPLSTQPPEIWPLRVTVELPGNKSSFAVLPGIRQVNKQRLLQRIGSASARSRRSLDDALAAYLND